VLALPVFASDALSSVAYATEEILLALVAGAAALSHSIPIALAIAALLAIVATSYKQTIHAYPSGGGAYIVARENLGIWPGSVAGAALLIDYVLTVAVSIAAGVAAITSAFPVLTPYRVGLCVVCVFGVALANLRGVKESGRLFAVPTYLFVGSFLWMIGVGVFRYAMHTLPPPPAQAAAATDLTGLALLFVMLRAFASGCAALTGVEAISNGVQAFRAPEADNAAKTMTAMAALLGTMFIGLTFLAHVLGIAPRDGETVASQIARATFGTGAWYFIIQAATALILILAANTSFADFPRLSALLARDRLLPRQLSHLGDRLVFSNGIMMLAILSSALIVLFRGETHLLIPLYAVGVFLSFTLSQTGMVVRWLRLGKRWCSRETVVNAGGACATGVVLTVIALEKFMPEDAVRLVRLPFTLPVIGDSIRAGAWMVVILIPLMVLGFLRIHEHYQSLRRQLTVDGWAEPAPLKHTVIVLVSNIHRGTVQALRYAHLIAADCRALCVDINSEDLPLFYRRWEEWETNIPLLVLDSPFRSITEPVLQYLDAVQDGDRNHMVTVILPEFVPARWWHHLLHNQSALLLKFLLLFRRNVTVTNLRYHLEE